MFRGRNSITCHQIIQRQLFVKHEVPTAMLRRLGKLLHTLRWSLDKYSPIDKA